MRSASERLLAFPRLRVESETECAPNRYSTKGVQSKQQQDLLALARPHREIVELLSTDRVTTATSYA
jgi:hypothetical protein